MGDRRVRHRHDRQGWEGALVIAARMVLSNLLYVVGAIVAATIVSGIVLLRHRRPKSLEAGIEMFSRELKALQPDRRITPGGADGDVRNGARAVGSAGARTRMAGSGGEPTRAARSSGESAPPGTGTRRRGLRAPSPDREDEPG